MPIPLGTKGPQSKGWQRSREACVTDPETAEFLSANVGLAHAYSGTCAIDVDDMESARPWLLAHGVDIDALIAAPDSVGISSGRPGRAKLLYALEKPLRHVQPVRGLEFRCGTRAGTSVQDVLPPSIHPDTGLEYTWVYGDDFLGHWSAIPPLPPELLDLWKSLVAGTTVTASTPQTVRSANLGQARFWLGHHDPDEGYEKWVQVGMALHHETDGGLDGFELWNEWSARGSKYKGREDLDAHWRSFRADTDSPITVASLRVDTAAEDEEFAPITEAELEAANLPAPRQNDALRHVINTLTRDNDGRPRALISNLIPILSSEDLCGQRLAYDSFQDILVCAPRGTDLWRPIRDTDYTATRLWLETVGTFNPVTKDMVRDAIYYVAENHKMDTAQNWLHSLKWDGVKRITNFFPTYMGTIATPYEYAVGEYLWSALAGRVMEPGCQVDMAIILVGAQGIGKSRGVQALVPDPAFYAEVRLDEPDEAIARKIRGVLVGEIAELRGLHTSELDRIKAFITRTHEKWIPKYIEFATTFARRVVFIGTTNEQEFLVDEENRRWLPVRTSGVDVEAISRDREQLWAEALIMWLENGVHWRNAQTLAKGEQEEFRVSDNWEPLVEQWLKDHPLDEVKTHDVLSMGVGLDIRNVTRAQEVRVGRVLKRFGYERTLKRVAGKPTRIWVKVKKA